MTLKLRQRTSKSPAAPFSWTGISPSPPSEPTLLPSPPTSWLPAPDMKMYGATPLTSTSDIGIAKCKDCDKPILRSAMANHVANCNSKKNKGSADADDKKNAKKRKASPTPDEPAKKKNKIAPKVTKGRMKGPLDLEKQCGVINDKGVPCSRALTCKSHSMGAKRAVEGRSRKYDDLLIEYQRANNPNFVEPATKRENKAEKKEKREKEKQEKKRLAEEAAAAMGIDISKKGSQASSSLKKPGKKAAVRLVDAGEEVEENFNDVDSETEVDDMVQSIRIARERGIIGLPLAVPCDASSWFVQSRERARVCRDLLLGALASSGAGIPGGLGLGGMGIGRTTSMSIAVPQRIG